MGYLDVDSRVFRSVGGADEASELERVIGYSTSGADVRIEPRGTG